MDSIYREIEELKKEKDAVILAHYYVPGEVQACADYIGDSFYLSKIATKLEASTLVFAGVTFMGESAKILNPEKNRTHAGHHSGLSYGPYGGCR